MRVDKHVRLNQAVSMESIYHFLTQRLIKKESVNEASLMGYGKYPHEGKLHEREFTMVIHHTKNAIQISLKCHSFFILLLLCT